MEIAYIKKKDIHPLWSLHYKNGVYIFNELRFCANKEDVLNNFYINFGSRKDYTIKKGERIVGLCSINLISWKNRSCHISYQFCDLNLPEAFRLGFSLFLGFLKKDLNLLTIRMNVKEDQLKELQELKIEFRVEGTLREHLFNNGKYVDIHIISVNQVEEGMVTA